MAPATWSRMILPGSCGSAVITGSKEDDFNVMDPKESLSSATQTLTAFLGAIAAAVSLLGCRRIGIMNIMLVAITERTREIGTRLAIGAMEREYCCSSWLKPSPCLPSEG